MTRFDIRVIRDENAKPDFAVITTRKNESNQLPRPSIFGGIKREVHPIAA